MLSWSKFQKNITIGHQKTSFLKFENSVSKQQAVTEYIKRTLYPEGNTFYSDYL